MKLRDLFKGTPVTPRRTETPEWHPLDELDDEPRLPKLHLPYGRCWCDEVHREAPVCTAPTKTGKPCSKPPRPGTDRCTLPAHQRAGDG